MIPILEIMVLVVFAAAPIMLADYLTVFVTRVLILALLALSFDLVWGYSGIMSFGQALFFGAAGYGVALLARDLGITSICIVLPAALGIGLALSFAIGGFLLLGRYPSTTIFVAMGTLTGSYAAERLARGWYYLGGQNGIPSIPPMTAGGYEFAEGPVYYYLALSVLMIVYLVCRFVVRSQFGLALAGARDQEARILFLGYQAQKLKLTVFSLAGAIAGLAGGLYAFHEGFVGPNMLGVVLSTQVVLYALFGGVGTLIGPVIGVVASGRSSSAAGADDAIVSLAGAASEATTSFAVSSSRASNAVSCRSIRSKAPSRERIGSVSAILAEAPSMAPTWESIRSQIRPSAPISRKRQEISRMTRTPLRTGARFCSSASSPSAADAAVLASFSAARSAASASAKRGSRTGVFCAASVSSIRATASSTIRVSALRLRLAYSPRNQRPREVSKNASLIAS